jgi:hypothetical protein
VSWTPKCMFKLTARSCSSASQATHLYTTRHQTSTYKTWYAVWELLLILFTPYQDMEHASIRTSSVIYCTLALFSMAAFERTLQVWNCAEDWHKLGSPPTPQAGWLLTTYNWGQINLQNTNAEQSPLLHHHWCHTVSLFLATQTSGIFFSLCLISVAALLWKNTLSHSLPTMWHG